MSTDPSICPSCGGHLLPDGGLCAVCLMALALPATASIDATTRVPTPETRLRDSGGEQPLLQAGQMFGRYRVERLLGRGGMGEVYAGEEIESGRRVALKVLSARLREPGDRARFLREGQLAASVTHPHVVYVFASEEIEGLPVIAMELLPGGTLKDRVDDGGPLPFTQAVDAILHVIAGLDAMHAAGVLHRDVKPANCFVDQNGIVKVGDFGLSIPTDGVNTAVTSRGALAPLTVEGSVRGTPQYAPPEQLRGDPLDLRADIYAVGATLYFLLTGRPPFESTNLFALLASVATEQPASPRRSVPTVPRELASVVMRCLAKIRDERPPTYAALHDALLPFSSAAPLPAPLHMRFLAGVIDRTILNVPNWVALMVPAGGRLLGWFPLGSLAIQIGYYAFTEGLWSATAGKWLAGLRVVRATGGRRPGIARAMWRTLLFTLPFYAATLLTMLLVERSRFDPPSRLITWVMVAPWLLLFTPARRHNGFAALHDRWSGTRVVERLVTAPPLSVPPLVPREVVLTPRTGRVGPFQVTGTLAVTDEGTLLSAYDPPLRRRVWIHLRAAGAPAVAAPLRDLARPARLRWLGGQRTATHSWDAYEAYNGAPLQTWLHRPWPWRVVRAWLTAVARELQTALDDGSLPVLRRDRVWITDKGDVKFLEFRYAPTGDSEPDVPLSSETGRFFLRRLAADALTGTADQGSHGIRLPYHRLPFSASIMLKTLVQKGGNSLDLVRQLAQPAAGGDRVQRGRRAGSLALTLAIPLTMGITLAAVMFPTRALVTNRSTPEIEELWYALHALSTHARSTAGVDVTALDVYIAGRYGPAIEAQGTWDPRTIVFLGRHAPRFWRIMADHPHVSNQGLTQAATQLKPFFDEQARLGQLGPGRSVAWWHVALGESALMLMLVAVAAILLAPLCRGGLALTLIDVVLITADGRQISRGRAFWRGVVTWGLVLMPLGFAPPPPLWLGTGASPQPGVRVAIVFWTLWAAGAMYAVARPSRGVQDHLSGTYLVPR